MATMANGRVSPGCLNERFLNLCILSYSRYNLKLEPFINGSVGNLLISLPLLINIQRIVCKSESKHSDLQTYALIHL